MSTDQLIADLRAKENIEKYWDFRRNDERNHVHSLIKYPAVMVPNMQGEIFDLVLKYDPEIRNVLDPFMGSGTILVEGLVRNLDVFGIDINPLSYLAVLVKMQKYAINSLKAKIDQLEQRIDLLNGEPIISYSFDGITKWYEPSVIRDLSKIRLCILQEPNIKYRRLFWVTFAEIAKQADNSRTSTFKLHIKLKESISDIKYDCIQNFKEKLHSNFKAIIDFKSQRKSKIERLYCGDSRTILSDRRRFAANSVDLVITSPPYGDNATTIPYGQYSVLPLRWIPISDINDAISLETVASLSKIDRDSLGGIYYTINDIAQSNILNVSSELNRFYNILLTEKMTDKSRKVASFVLDFSEVIKNLAPIIKPGKLLVFTIGNRQVHKMEMPFHLILKEIAEYYGMDMKYDFRRNIIKNKNYVDTAAHGFKTINKETIMILQKR